ncbi:MAG: FecR domain-containing protein [Pseudomonadota bacterium]
MKPSYQTGSNSVTDAAYYWFEIMQAGAASDADSRAFEAWLEADSRHEEAYDRAVTLWAAYDQLESAEIDADLMREANAAGGSALAWLLAALTPSRRGLALGAAALALFYVGINLFGDLRPTGPDARVELHRLTTGIGETVAITLEDGTEATLGAKTELDIAFSENERWVLLRSGAAYFDIAKDRHRPFRVRSGALTASALGTAFEARNNADVVRVEVAEGEVSVDHPAAIFGIILPWSTSQALLPGDRIVALSRTEVETLPTIPTDQVGQWRSNRLIYDGAPLRELVADANRYSATPIRIEGSAAVGEQTVTAAFSPEEIDFMLSTLEQILPVQVDRSVAGQILIRAEDTP